MKKKSVLITIIIMAALCVGLLAVFLLVDFSQKNKYSVNFIVEDQVYATINIDEKGVKKFPVDPSREGYDFDGWYLDNGVWEEVFNENTTINSHSSVINVYSKWHAIEYVARFYADGNYIGYSTFIIEDNLLTNVPEVPEKIGYNGSWEGYTIAANDLTINAIYSIGEYDVVYNENGGSELANATYTYGEGLTSLPTANDIKRDGYIFKGWKDSQSNSIVTNISSTDYGNKTLIAQWEAIEYTASFYAEGNLVGTSTFTVEDSHIGNIPNIPEKIGYIGTWEEYTIAAHDLTINAVYSIGIYEVVYDENGGSDLTNTTYTYGEGLVSLPNTSDIEREGYVFKGWKDSKSNEFVTNISSTDYGNKTFIAQWEAIEYTASFYADDKLVGNAIFTMDDEIIENAPIVPLKVGYDGVWEDYTISAHDLIINAVYTIKIFTITWENYDNSILEISNNVEYGSLPKYTGVTPVKENDARYKYTFNSWTPTIVEAREDAIYVATFSQSLYETYTIKYDANGGAGAPVSQTKAQGGSITLSNVVPIKEGYIFAGWNNIYEDKVYQKGSTFSSDINLTLYAMWENNCSNCNGLGTVQNKISCSTCSGSGRISTSTWVNCSGCKGSGKLYYYSACSTCKGFGGNALCECICGNKWWANQTGSRICSRCGRSVVANLYGSCSTCSGKGTVQKSQNCNSCSGSGGRYVSGSTSCTNCSGNGYNYRTVTCDYCNGSKVNKLDAPTYTTINDRSVILTSISGYEYSLDGTIWQGSNIFENLKPSTKYTFYQRTKTNGDVPFGTTSAPLTITTKSTTKYYVTYNLEGGINNSENPLYYYSTGSNITLITPTKEHYDFVGWRYNGNVVEKILASWAKDIELTATWTLHNYEIKYELAGGTTTNPTSYTFDSDEIILSDAVRKGYTFVGWTGHNGNEPQKNVVISSGSSEDIEFIANWSPNIYTLTFVTNSGTDIAPITQECDSLITIENPYIYGMSFCGWYDVTLSKEVDLTRMPSEDMTVYAKWCEYSVTLTCDEISAISVDDEIIPSKFNAHAIDTDGNSVEVTIQVVAGEKVEGDSLTVRLIARGLYDIYDTKTVYGIEIYGTPIISYNTEKDYINLSDDITPTLFGAVAVDTFGNNLLVNISVKEESYEAGDVVTIILIATDVANNTKIIEIPNIKVYGGAIITKNENIIDMRESDIISNQLFGVYATDHFGEYLDVTTVLYDGTQIGGNIITIKSYATDCKGNTSYITYDIKVYSTPTILISDASKLNYAEFDTISLETLGITARDSFNNNISNIILELIDGIKVAGNILTYRVTATDHLGNLSTKDYTNIKIYGTPTISYDYSKDSINYNDSINASLFNSTARDSFNNELAVSIELNSGVIVGGSKVTFKLSTIDVVGNKFEIITNEIKVYSSDDIVLTYFVTANNIKLISKGEEFNATASNSFGEECDIIVVPASGYSLEGGHTIDLYLIATDALGNTTQSELISNINIYDTPTLSYIRDQDYIQKGDNPYALFSVKDSFDKELLFDVEIVNGSLDINETITYRIIATDRVGNELNLEYTLSVLASQESEIKLYKNGQLIEIRRIYNGDLFNLPVEEGCNAVWHLDGIVITDNNGESLAVWDYESNIYILTTDYYTLTFDVNGGECETVTQLVNLDANYVLPVPNRVGYTFVGWFVDAIQYFDGIWSEKRDVTLIANWTPNTNTTYVVNHYQQNIDDDEYTLYSTQTLSGTSDANVTPSTKTYTGFTSPAKKSTTILPNGSRVVDYYYKRNKYTLTIIKNDGKTTTKSLKYQANLMDNATITRNGYTLGGYYKDKDLITSITTMPYSATTIYAWWEEENKPTDFTYTGSSTITINKYIGSSSSMSIPSYIGNIPVRIISSLAFENCSLITTAVVPDTVTSIGEGAFKGCNRLTSITLPFVGKTKDVSTSVEGSTSTSKGSSYLFGYIFGATSVSSSSSSLMPIRTDVTYQGQGSKYNSSDYKYYWTFYYIPKTLTTVTITNATGISANAFYGCDKLTSITLNNEVSIINSNAFYGCTALTSFTVPTNTTSIGDYAFYRCTVMSTLTFNDKVSKIGDYAFYNCTKVTEITLPNALTKIGNYAFYGNRLTTLTIPSKVTEIGNYAFYFNTVIKEIAIPGNVISIGNYAFSGNTAVTTLTIASGVKTIGAYAFESMSITEAVVPDTVTSIGEGAFKGCNRLTSITLPFVGKTKDVSTSVEGSTSTSKGSSYLFGYIFGATSVSSSSSSLMPIRTDVTYQGQGSKYNSSDYKYYWTFYYIPKTLTTVTITNATGISANAFYGCDKLTSITLNNEVTTIYEKAFYGCTSLQSMIIPYNVTTMGANVFTNCSLLTIHCERLEQPTSWNSKWNSSNCVVCWYSEIQPITSCNYWHYVDGVVTKWE